MEENPESRSPWLTEARALIALSLPLVTVLKRPASAAEFNLKYATGQDPTHPVNKRAQEAIDRIREATSGIGLTSAVSPLIASERGRKLHSVRDIRRSVRQTAWAAGLLCLPAWLLLWQAEAVLIAIGQDPELAARATELVHGLQWGLFPYFLFLVLRNFVAALEKPIWGVIVTLLTVPFNAFAGWVLIFGHLGLPAMGLRGAGLASLLTSCFMAIGMGLVVMRDRRFRRYRLFGRFWVADWPRFKTVWKIGLPIAITVGFEATVFNAAVFLMGLIGRAELAAHAIAIQIAALCFMVPMGVGQAATVRVGYAHGRGDPAAVGRAGWLALGLGGAFSAAASALLLFAPRPLIGAFIDVDLPANMIVVDLAVSFLAVAALFQLVDCTQAIAAGVLRGLQDTRVPMIFAAFGYWVVGIGTGVLFAFRLHLDGVGIWLGLAAGLGVVSVLLVWRWMWRERLGLLHLPVERRD